MAVKGGIGAEVDGDKNGHGGCQGLEFIQEALQCGENVGGALLPRYLIVTSARCSRQLDVSFDKRQQSSCKIVASSEYSSAVRPHACVMAR